MSSVVANVQSLHGAVRQSFLWQCIVADCFQRGALFCRFLLQLILRRSFSELFHRCCHSMLIVTQFGFEFHLSDFDDVVSPQRWHVIKISPCFEKKSTLEVPHAVSGVVRIDPLHFLAGCRTRRLNQVQLCFISQHAFIVSLLIRAPFYVLLIFVGMCSVFWLFQLSCHYLPSDWLERPSEEA